MLAARLYEGNTQLTVEDVPDPTVRSGCAVVRLEAAFISPYMASLIDGSGGFETPLRPFIPGMDAVGVIESVADDVEGIKPGDRVYCDSYIESPTYDGLGEFAFVGCFAISENSGPLLNRWPNGTLAEKMLLPAENLTPVEPAIEHSSVESLCRLGWFGTAYSAFEKTGFQAGQSVAVLGATGLLGSSTVLLALALGASRVIAVGRSKDRLAGLCDLDPRVETATHPPRAGDAVDLAISAMAGDDPTPLENALLGLKRYGSLVQLASLGNPPKIAGLVTRDISLRGSLWFPRQTPSRLVSLIASGALRLDRIKSHTYSLNEVNEAIARGAEAVEPFEQIVVQI